MNVNNSPNINNAAELYKTADLPNSTDVQETRQTAKAAAAGAGTASSGASTSDGVHLDDVHLSELVRSLRSLASDSPERQSRIEQLARTAANGSYKVDPQATADAIIHDATSSASA